MGLDITPIFPNQGDGSNATSIQGDPVSALQPTDGQVLVFDAATQQYIPQTWTAGPTFTGTANFNSANFAGIVRFGTATTADALSDVLISPSASTQRAVTIQGRAGQSVPLLRIVESSNNSANNGWSFEQSALTFALSGSQCYLNAAVFVGQPNFRFRWSSAANNPFATETTSIQQGAGTPEGVITARPGAIYLRNDGGAGTSFYVKESGTGNTGWVAK